MKIVEHIREVGVLLARNDGHRELRSSVVFDVPSSMRTILIDFSHGFRWERYHLSLPAMRFRAVFDSAIDSAKWHEKYDVYLSSLAGVFLGGDGEVYPMILPNISADSIICLGGTKRFYNKTNLDVVTDEIYSNFIQSDFTNEGSIQDFINSYCLNFDDFYTDWSSKGRNYDICSDVRVKSYRDYIRQGLNPFVGTYLSMGGGE